MLHSCADQHYVFTSFCSYVSICYLDLCSYINRHMRDSHDVDKEVLASNFFWSKRETLFILNSCLNTRCVCFAKQNFALPSPAVHVLDCTWLRVVECDTSRSQKSAVMSAYSWCCGRISCMFLLIASQQMSVAQLTPLGGR